jgi:tetratricopeptide (TPR) repeat protein
MLPPIFRRIQKKPSATSRIFHAARFFLYAAALIALMGAGARVHAAPVIPDSTQTPPSITAASLVQRGNDLYNKGEFAKALLLYQRAESRGADPTTVAFNEGNCLFRLNQLPQAAALFRKAVRLSDGKFQGAELNLAAVLFRLEQYGETIAAYRRALDQDPANLSAWLYLADAYTRVKDYVGALQAMEKARNLDSDDVTLVYQTAEIHAALKEYDQAIALVREAFARKPSEVDFLFYIGDLYRAEGKLPEAAAAYREGLSLRENDVDALYKLSDVLAQDNKSFLAMDYLQKALLLKPDFSDAAIFLGNLAFDAKLWDRSEDAYLQALKLGNREAVEGLRNLAFEFHRQGRDADAAALLEKALPLRPGDVDLKSDAEQYRDLAKAPVPIKQH